MTSIQTRRIRVLLALVVLGVVWFPEVAAGAGTRATAPALRPDIVPAPTSQVMIRLEDGHKRLYLSFETENAGSGPLEVQPVQEDCDGNGDTTDDRTGVQDIYGDTDGSGAFTPGVDTVVRTEVVGCFEFDPDHGHWHFDNYARYRLLTLNGRRLRAQSKVGFCMLDSLSVDPGLPGYSSTRRYTGCPDLELQGISVGWADVYGVNIPGQFIPIGGIPNGTYCLLGRADPDNRLLETDDANNVVRTRILIDGTVAAIRPKAC
ncbi:MAG: hypothetical protein QOK29_5204 [Rhodospirillaceae bacterium]|nr:hypothetical protein [Rhodospirillaceae bacterium]